MARRRGCGYAVATQTRIVTATAMVQKDEIIAQIHRIAKADGAPPGRQRFENVTGIKRHEWYGLHWARWGDALEEAGLSSNVLQGQFEKEAILKAYVGLVQKLGRVPSEGDIRLARRSDQSFPSHSTLGNHIGLQRERLNAAFDYAITESLDASIIKILGDAIESLPPEVNKTDIEVVDGVVTGFVYLMKSGKYYKIGKTNSIDRRQYEIGLHVAEGVEPIHSIETDDPSGIEAYWHNRFKDKRMNGEWFNLSTSDIRAFRLRKKFM